MILETRDGDIKTSNIHLLPCLAGSKMSSYPCSPPYTWLLRPFGGHISKIISGSQNKDCTFFSVRTSPEVFLLINFNFSLLSHLRTWTSLTKCDCFAHFLLTSQNLFFFLVWVLIIPNLYSNINNSDDNNLKNKNSQKKKKKKKLKGIFFYHSGK